MPKRRLGLKYGTWTFTHRPREVNPLFGGSFGGNQTALRRKKPLWDDDLSDWFRGKLSSSAVLKTLGLDPEYLPLRFKVFSDLPISPQIHWGTMGFANLSSQEFPQLPSKWRFVVTGCITPCVGYERLLLP